MHGRALLPILGCLAMASPAAAAPLEIHVLAHTDIGQVAGVQTADGQPYLRTNGFGVITVDVQPGQVLRISRDGGQAPPFVPPSCAAPEDPGGVSYTVPSPVPSSPVNVTVPDAGQPYHPETNDKESWLIGQINKIRADRGLQPLTVASTLMRAADETARSSLTANTFPPPYCAVLLVDAGWPSLSANAVDAPGTDPVAALHHWDGTDGTPGSSERANQGVLNADNAYVGVGDADGWFVADFQTASGCPADAQVRCGIQSGSYGDPNAWTPPAGSGSGSGAGSGGAAQGSNAGAGPGTAGASRVPDALIRQSLTAFAPAPALSGSTVRAGLKFPIGGSLAWRLELTGFRTARAARKIVLGAKKVAVAPGAVTLRLKLSRAGKKAIKRTRGGRIALRLTFTTTDGRVFHGTGRVKKAAKRH